MLRISLSDPERSELQARRRSDLSAVARDRLEMVLLSDAGWSPPRIAAHLGRHPHTVRAALHGYAARGAEAFQPDKPGPDPDHARRAEVAGKLTGLLGQDRTWTSRQLAAALGLGIGPRQTRRYLGLLKAGYRRTAQTVGHKRDPAKVGRAERVLGGLKKKQRPAASASSTWTSPGSPRPSRSPIAGAYPGNGNGSRTSTRRAGG